MKKTKEVWTWVLPTSIGTAAREDGDFVFADLFFSTKEKFFELSSHTFDPDREALIKVTVDEDFEDLDYIPDNY